ncbi:hypothetical protein LI328DRAFT_143794 [Trichoderma asperelloides]|nr:hypothetical protein LI328DRAFT_143794 [Trichoderma asperelloides]
MAQTQYKKVLLSPSLDWIFAMLFTHSSSNPASLTIPRPLQPSTFTPTTSKMVESCSKPSNFGRGAYDTTGLPKPPPPQPQ